MLVNRIEDPAHDSKPDVRRFRVLVAQLGARRHYAVPRAFEAAGSLERLITDAAAGTFPWRFGQVVPVKCQPAALRKILDRQIQGIPESKVHGCLHFTVSNAARRGGHAGRSHAEMWCQQNEEFCVAVSRQSWKDADTVYAFNGCALEIFAVARSRGLRCVLDQTAAPWRYNTELLLREQERWPGWEALPADLDSRGSMIAREEAEWRLADLIVCGSSFVVDAIQAVGGPVEKCVVVEYPTPTVRSVDRARRRGAPTRMLFVGTLQLRKGIQYLWKMAGECSQEAVVFRAIGPSALTPEAEERVRERIEVVGPVRRAEVEEHLAWADVFILPTLSEGCANVCLEAAAAGLPVATSRAAGLSATNWKISPFLNRQATQAPRVPNVELYRPRSPEVLLRSVNEYGADLARAIRRISE